VFWLALIIIGGIAGATLARPERFARLGGRKQKLLPPPSNDLAAYAEANGWKIYPGDEKQIQAEAWKLFTMAGPPSLEVLYALKAMNPMRLAREPEAYYREPWQPMVLLRRDTADGPQTILSASAAGGTRAVIACVGTQATVDQFGLDIVGWDSKVYASGDAPEGIEFGNVLAGLSAPLRIRFAEGTLLLRVPAKLTPKFIDTIMERLDAVREALPRRPDLGPQR